MKKYKAREKLYRIPLKLRRYCKSNYYLHVESQWVTLHTSGKHAKPTGVDDKPECGPFLLPRPTLPPGKENFVCSDCGGQTCRDCEAPLSASHHLTHKCPGPADPPMEDVDLKDLQRGRDYQLCPNTECQLKVELSDGCNYLTCRQTSCTTQLCYICGKEAEDGSDHWATGKPCPRWNQLGTAEAHWDEDANARAFAALPNVTVEGTYDADRNPDGNFQLCIKYEVFTERCCEWLEEHLPGPNYEWVRGPRSFQAFVTPVVKLRFIRGGFYI